MHQKRDAPEGAPKSLRVDYRLGLDHWQSEWICVEHDDVVPSHQSRLMFELAPDPKRLVVLPGSGHYRAYVEHLDTIRAEIEAWFGSHLGPPEPQILSRG